MLYRLSISLLLLPVALFAQQDRVGGAGGDRAKERLQAIARAKVQLSEKLEIPEGKITLESATATSWPDTSLGCPEKGLMYAQVVTRGYTVRLKASGATHEIHVAGRRAVICREKPNQPGR